MMILVNFSPFKSSKMEEKSVKKRETAGIFGFELPKEKSVKSIVFPFICMEVRQK